MSVNRELYGTAEETRKGFKPAEWGVVSLLVKDLPPRKALPHVAHSYHLRPRHVPENGNPAHSEVRVWREDTGEKVLISDRTADQFEEGDPDREERRSGSDQLEAEFHLRWRKQMEWRCKSALKPDDD